jgi:hypothetical protein
MRQPAPSSMSMSAQSSVLQIGDESRAMYSDAGPDPVEVVEARAVPGGRAREGVVGAVPEE